VKSEEHTGVAAPEKERSQNPLLRGRTRKSLDAALQKQGERIGSLGTNKTATCKKELW